MFARPMRYLFVTPEVSPYSAPEGGGSTPTGDACAALAKALKGRGHEVVVLSPLYGFVDAAGRGLARRLRKVEVELDGEKTPFQVYDGRTAAGIDLLFLGHEELFAHVREVPKDSRDLGDGRRFGAFCKGAIQVLQNDEKGFDVVHCHGWQTALVPVLVDLLELEVGTVQTVYDVAQQGLFDREILGQLGLPDRLWDIEGLEFHGQVSFLKGGVLEADRVTTVSPTYAKEITQDGAGLEGVFAQRGSELTGIAFGVDVAVWNPTTDAYLEARYDPMDRAGKRRCKVALQSALELPVRDDVALIAVIGELRARSGLDALARVVSRLMRNDVQIAVLGEGEGDKKLVEVLQEHAKRWPDRLAVRDDLDVAEVHRALGGADCVLVPPNQAPGGNLQLRAHRYGALPIGLRADGVADTVVDCDPELTTGNGFLFDEASDEALLGALQRAIGGFSRRAGFEKARERALRADHGWERSAYLYERLYSAI